MLGANITILLLAICVAGTTCYSARLANSELLDYKTMTKNISPEIVNELKDFLDLIPQIEIDEIVAEHFITDTEFRRAFKYVQSSEFTALMDQMQQIPEVNQILEFLHLLTDSSNSAVSHGGESQEQKEKSELLFSKPKADVNNGMNFDFASIDEIIEKETLMNAIYATLDFVPMSIDNEKDVQSASLTLPASRSPKSTRSRLYGMAFYEYELDSFTSFVAQLMQHLPRDKFANLIKAKCQKSPAFNAFYVSLRDERLRPMVESAVKSSNLQKSIQTLKSHAIDVEGLMPIGFNVISWGPAP